MNAHAHHLFGVIAIAIAASSLAAPSTEAAPMRMVPGRDVAGLIDRATRTLETLEEGNAELGRLLMHRLKVTRQAGTKGFATVQRELDPHCLVEIAINPESRVKVAAGAADLRLTNGEARFYLVKVVNEAGVTAPLRITTAQSYTPEGGTRRDAWLEVQAFGGSARLFELSGRKVDYRVVRLRGHAVGKRSALIAADVGQGTADIGFRNDTLLTFVCSNKPPIDLSNSRPPQSDDDLRYWLQNMVGDHGFSVPETQEATGLDASSIRDALDRFGIERGQQAPSVAGGPRLRLLPYPGGRHPRIGFREAAIRPQRETKASVFTPWDPKSYVVLDVPEAIWSNLGLTYLAHVDVPTLWEQKEIGLKPLEWRRGADGRLQCERELPNGIRFGVDLVPRDDSVQMAMWIHNGTESELTGLRVQNCALLAGANGFSAQTNDNKVFWKSYAACRDDSGKRWIIMAWSPIHGAWGNAECPCLHADPKFADCPPGDTVSARGMLSFFTGTDIQSELQRLEQTGWREGALATRKVALRGNIVDAETGKPVAARVRLQDSRGRRYTVNSTAGQAVGYRRELSHLPDSPEVHTSVSADPFHVDLEPGVYSLRVERGKEYLPALQTIRVGDAGADVEVRLQRWANAAERGWYSGDLHVHRPLEELPTAMLAEDLNVSFPITQWVTDSRSIPSEARSRDWGRGLIRVDPSHVIQTRNTEYEIITVNGRRHTLGSLLVLNQRTPLTLGTPPVAGVAGDVQRQGALLDLDKHSWPWSLVIAPVMGVDLFELANNHLWETDFGFHDFTVDTVGEYMNLERNSRGLTERGWLHYGLETYYALLNCGLDLRVSAGTASGVHPVPLGFGRVYVHLSSGFDFEAWMEGLSAGRSFVTTGPLLYARFNGAQPGARLVAGGERAQAVLVEGEALSRSPLRRIEVLRNGELVHSIVPANVKLAAGGYRSRFEVDVSVDSTSWVAVRCFEDRVDGRVRFAHTNPAHVAVPGRPLMPSKEQIDYLVARVRQEVRNNASVLDQASLAEFRRALGFYEAIATRVHAQKDREERVAHAP